MKWIIVTGRLGKHTSYAGKLHDVVDPAESYPTFDSRKAGDNYLRKKKLTGVMIPDTLALERYTNEMRGTHRIVLPEEQSFSMSCGMRFTK